MSELVKELSLETRVVAISSLHPNPWNPNRQTDRVYQAERDSIREYGFIDPVTVRHHPEREGEWQIIDGEHRWRAARDEGYTEVLIGILPPMTDAAAKKLTIILNETRGESDVTLLGKLLAEIQREQAEDLTVGLPYSDSELEHLLSLASVEWDAFDGSEMPIAGDDERPPDVLSVAFTSRGDYERVQTFLTMLGAEWECEPDLVLVRTLGAAASEL
jgi:ParB/RepB/Spo0J family partition protein